MNKNRKIDIFGGSVILAFLLRNGRGKVLLSWLVSVLISILTVLIVTRCL